MDGLALTFRLAGIINQNFLMRDEQTGTFWQQISGTAISGPLAGRQLELVPSDELTFGLWNTEQPGGTLLQDSAADAALYAEKSWEGRMQKSATVLDYSQPGLQPRTLVLGIRAKGASPQEVLLREKLIQDRLGAIPIAIVVGPDGQSIRGFRAELPGAGQQLDLYWLAGENGAIMVVSVTGSRWNFQGCAVTGKAVGVCLDRLNISKDYWFTWRHYSPSTTIFQTPR